MNTFTPSIVGLLQPPQWTPASLSQIYSWFDAQFTSSITKDGSNNVSQWVDRSGKGGVMTSSGTTYPIYSATGLNSRPALGFTAVGGNELFFDNYLLDFLRAQTNITVIMVMTRNEVTGPRYMWYWSTATAANTRLEIVVRTDKSFSLGERQADGDSYYQDNPNGANCPAQGANFILRLNCNYSAGQGYMYSSTYSDTTAMPSLAGFGRTTAVSDTRSAAGWIGAGTETSSNFSIGEFILCRGALSAGDVASLNTYLKAKWGL